MRERLRERDRRREKARDVRGCQRRSMQRRLLCGVQPNLGIVVWCAEEKRRRGREEIAGPRPVARSLGEGDHGGTNGARWRRETHNGSDELEAERVRMRFLRKEEDRKIYKRPLGFSKFTGKSDFLVLKICLDL